MTETQIYWFVTLPKLSQGVGGFLLFCGILAIMAILIVWGSNQGESYGAKMKWETVKKQFSISVLTTIIGGLLLTFIPTTKELVAIYTIPKVVNNEQVQAIPEKLLELANLKLDDLLQEED